jgi:DnaK suppressor protein
LCNLSARRARPADPHQRRLERLLRDDLPEAAMRGIVDARGAGFARKALLARKRKLSALAAGLPRGEDQLQAGRRPDQLDRAADLETRDILERLHAVESREQAEIEAALKRLATGTYGRCERCLAPVGPYRLQAFPEARLCVSCAVRP